MSRLLFFPVHFPSAYLLLTVACVHSNAALPFRNDGAIRTSCSHNTSTLEGIGLRLGAVPCHLAVDPVFGRHSGTLRLLAFTIHISSNPALTISHRSSPLPRLLIWPSRACHLMRCLQAPCPGRRTGCCFSGTGEDQ